MFRHYIRVQTATCTAAYPYTGMSFQMACIAVRRPATESLQAAVSQTHYCRIVSPLSPAAVHCHRCQVSKHHRPQRIKAPLKPHQCAQRSVPSVPSCRMNTLSGSWALDYWATRHGKACRFLPIHFSGPSIATVSVCVCVCPDNNFHTK